MSLLLLWSDVLEVLVPEDYDASFCYELGKLILLSAGQPRKLETRDLGSGTRRQLGDLQLRVDLA